MKPVYVAIAIGVIVLAASESARAAAAPYPHCVHDANVWKAYCGSIYLNQAFYDEAFGDAYEECMKYAEANCAVPGGATFNSTNTNVGSSPLANPNP